MKPLKIFLLSIPLMLVAFTSMHKYYVSVTQIEYVKEKQSLQIITRIFIDDFEKMLRQRYDKEITLDTPTEKTSVNYYTEKYLLEKVKININGKPVILKFIGKEYENDILICYLEVENIPEILNFKVSNAVLMDLFREQENVIRTHINGKYKSFILNTANDKALLNFM